MRIKLLALASILIIAGCAPSPKIAFDLDKLDSNGLQGSDGSKRSLSYEYCAPNTPQWHKKLKTIDPSSRFMERSPGHSKCKSDEMLVLGETHQPHFNTILKTLSSYDEISIIREAHFE